MRQSHGDHGLIFERTKKFVGYRVTGLIRSRVMTKVNVVNGEAGVLSSSRIIADNVPTVVS